MGLDNSLPIALSPILGFLISTVLAYLLGLGKIPWLQVLDHPNHRSLHSRPIPRTGGLAILASLLLAMGLASIQGLPVELGWIAAAVIPVVSASFLDDLGDVPRRYRLLAQVAGGLILLTGGIGWWLVTWPGGQWAPPTPLAWALTLLFVVWMTNLYNFMDGIDGLAGGMAVLGFGALAILGWQGGDMAFAMTAAAVAAAAGGFLTSNFPPARLFLGDVGSSLLGLLAAALALWGSNSGLFPLWAAWLAFSPFIVDATLTLLQRIARREPIWLPHRSHYYQSLVLAGWSHRTTTLRAYLLMAAAGASAIAVPAMPERAQWTLIGIWGVIYLLIHVKVRILQRRTAASSPKP